MSQHKEYEKFLKEGQKLSVKEIKSRLFQMDVDFDWSKTQKKYFVEIYDKKIKDNVFRDKISDRLRKDYDEQKNEMKKRKRKNEPKKEIDQDSGKRSKLVLNENTLNESVLANENLSVPIFKEKTRSKSLSEHSLNISEREAETDIINTNVEKLPEEETKITSPINLQREPSTSKLNFVIPTIFDNPPVENLLIDDQDKMDLVQNFSESKQETEREVIDPIKKIEFSPEKQEICVEGIKEKSSVFEEVLFKENEKPNSEFTEDIKNELKCELKKDFDDLNDNSNREYLTNLIKINNDNNKKDQSNEVNTEQVCLKINSQIEIDPSSKISESKISNKRISVEELKDQNNIYYTQENKNDQQLFKPLDSSDKLFREIKINNPETIINNSESRERSLNKNDNVINKIPAKINSRTFRFPNKESRLENLANPTLFPKLERNVPKVNEKLSKREEPNKDDKINLFFVKQKSLIYTLPNPSYVDNTNFFKSNKINIKTNNELNKFTTNIKRNEFLEKSTNYFNSIRFNKDRSKLPEERENHNSVQNTNNYLRKSLRNSVSLLNKKSVQEAIAIPNELSRKNMLRQSLIEENLIKERESFGKKSQKNINDNNKKVVIKEIVGETVFTKNRDSLKSHLRNSIDSASTVKVSSKSIIILKITVISATVILSLYIFLRVCYGNDLSATNYFNNLFDFNSFSLDTSSFLRIRSWSYLEENLNPSHLLSFFLVNFWKTATITLIIAVIIRMIMVKRKNSYYKETTDKVYERVIRYLIDNGALSKVLNTEEFIIGKFSKEFNVNEDEFKTKIFPLVKDIAKDCKHIRITNSDTNNNQASNIVWSWEDNEDP